MVEAEGRAGVGIGEGDVRLILGDAEVAFIALATELGVPGVDNTRVRDDVGVATKLDTAEVTRGRGLVGVMVEVECVDMSLDKTTGVGVSVCVGLAYNDCGLS